MDKVPDARVRQLCGLTKGVDEKIDEIVLRWFGRVERMENNRIAKRVYVDECAGSRSVGRPQKRWINTLKDCLKKRGLDVRQAGKIVHDRSVWRGFVRWNAWDIAGGDEPWCFTTYHSCEIPQPYEALEGRKSVCGQAHNLRV